MKIAVVNEVSCCTRNSDIMEALSAATDAEIINFGMTGPEDAPELSYIHIGYMTGILLGTHAVDFVISGCGTGQGYLNCALQFPGVSCGHICDPLDAWLFSQINGGNCISLMLNKGYGWAAGINLQYIFEKLFADPAGGGYPPHRVEAQAKSRATLAEVSKATHYELDEILRRSDPEILKVLAQNEKFMEVVRAADQKIADLIG